jgi:hypothetical protein
MSSHLQSKLILAWLIAILSGLGSVVAIAQSPNTASLVTEAFDESGAILADAALSIVNTATGSRRDSVRDSNGTGTVAAWPGAGN